MMVPVGMNVRLVGTALVTVLVLLFAMQPVKADESPADPDPAMAWLERMGPALNMTSYRGVFVYARGDRVHSMRIAHRYRNGRVEERLVMQDGGSGEIVRKGMNVVCVLPDRGRISLEEVIPSGPFAEAFTSQLMPFGQWYQPELIGEDRVAGYDVVTVALTARDSDRYSHEVQTRGREITRTLDDAGQPRQSMIARMNGWTLNWRPEGFEPAAAPRSGKGKAVAFSDGLAAFSVFVEPMGRLKMPTGASRIGATTVYMREVAVKERAFLIAVVGEIPPATARKVADGVKIDGALGLVSER